MIFCDDRDDDDFCDDGDDDDDDADGVDFGNDAADDFIYYRILGQ